VGLPLEVDKENLHKNDYVRVKIGCRDVTKVPASVDGLLDFHFYDYFFQREVPQDGYTDSSGTKWIRNEKDKPKDDFPSPKKQKMDPPKNVSQSSGAGTSNTVNVDKGKQVAGEGYYQNEAKQMARNDDDSEDEGLKIGNLIEPGSDQLRFGNFDHMEVRMLTSIHFDDAARIVINEYGSNMEKFKSDPLATIEAKNALYGSNRNDIFQFDKYMIKSGPSKDLSTTIEDKKAVFDKERAISVSPVKGSQGGPEIELSSQEECMIKESQDIDWELIQKEDDHVSHTT
jgi:hypothetical protein